MEEELFLREPEILVKVGSRAAPDALRKVSQWLLTRAAKVEAASCEKEREQRKPVIYGNVFGDVPADYQERLVDSFGILPRKTKEDCHAFLSWCRAEWADTATPGPNLWYHIYRHAVGHFHVAKRTRIKAYRKYLPHRANVQNPWKYLLAIMLQDYSCFDDWLLRRNRQVRQTVPSEETI